MPWRWRRVTSTARPWAGLQRRRRRRRRPVRWQSSLKVARRRRVRSQLKPLIELLVEVIDKAATAYASDGRVAPDDFDRWWWTGDSRWDYSDA